jgi:hypothetical protein
MANDKKWIQKALSGTSRGALHKQLGVPEGKKIPAKKMAKAAKSSNATVRKEVGLAKTLKAISKAKR